MRGFVLAVLLCAGVAHAEERKLYLSISAQGGGLLAYERINVTNEYSPALLINAYVTAGYRVSPKLSIGGTAGALLAPLGARIRVWVDRDRTDVTYGFGYGFFIGGNLSVFLQDRLVLENGFGFSLIGAPGAYGGFGPTLNEAIAYRFKGDGEWKYGFDVRLLWMMPSLFTDTRSFGMQLAVTAGFSIALQ